jgi:hypothetical protein
MFKVGDKVRIIDACKNGYPSWFTKQVLIVTNCNPREHFTMVEYNTPRGDGKCEGTVYTNRLVLVESNTIAIGGLEYV